MSTSIAYVANTNEVMLLGLKDRDSYISTATVTANVYDGESLVYGPITLTYVTGSNGDYLGFIPAATALDTGKHYTVKFDANASDETTERILYIEHDMLVEERN